MSSVTQRIKSVQQPYGGYIKVKDLEKITLDDGKQLNPESNIHATLLGLSVDYLSRYMLTKNAASAFSISLLGAAVIQKERVANKLIKNIHGLDDQSIINACKLCGFDVCYRASPSGYKDISLINPDKATIQNIRIMVDRSLDFFKEYGPVVQDGFTFEGGYTSTVSSGDGDFLTQDTLWDFKVSKNNPTSKHTLQLLMYYIMGKHSVHAYFNSIKYIGIFNPYKNIIYRYNLENLSQEFYDEVSYTVIGYGNSDLVNTTVILPSPKSSNPPINKSTVTSKDISIKETAKLLNISTKKVKKLIKKEILTGRKIGNKYYVKKSSISSYKERLKRYKLIRILIVLILLLIGVLYLAQGYLY